MRHLPRLALLTCALCCASTAIAQVPSPANSTIPNHVNLVGLGPAGADSVSGHCYVVHRDLANNPVPGAVITFDFSAVGDMTIASDQPDPRLTVNCATRTVSAVTDANGRADLTIVGAGIPGRPASAQFQFHIYADGILLGSPTLSAFDLNGTGGVDLTDLGLWLVDYVSGTNPMRSDFDGTGGVSLVDFSIWSAAFFHAGSPQSAASYCP